MKWTDLSGPWEAAKRALHRLKWTLILSVVVGLVVYEARTSALQSLILSTYAKRISYSVQPGPSPNIVFPGAGPFDVRSGYTQIPEFERRLAAKGYQVAAQARFSPDLQRLARWGIVPPFHLPTSTELTVLGKNGESLFRAPIADREYRRFEDIPPIMIRALLLIENRELEHPSDYRSNPAVDWDRLAKAALLYAEHTLGLPVRIQGGSTLATQMQKYRFSDGGRTDSVFDKLRQMTGASLLAYRKGPDTRAERRQIVLDYLNSLPLAAAPGYGEVHGIGNGLYAWFGGDAADVSRDLDSPKNTEAKVTALKEVLELLCAVRAPSYYLLRNRSSLEARVNFYTEMLVRAEALDPEVAHRLESIPVRISPHAPLYPLPSYAEQKSINAIRNRLVHILGLPSFYELDRLHLEVNSTVDASLQHSAIDIFRKLKDPEFLTRNGLRDRELLASGDPGKVIYGFLLFEKTPLGNLLRVDTDTLNGPFDINDGMKMQLGSTAKLRTLANYLAIVDSLYGELSTLGTKGLQEQIRNARDPITRWAAETLLQNPALAVASFLQKALDRKYSASPHEAFFTGGGIHVFRNFDADDNGRILTVREATDRSVNLVYIRLMRDLVEYYEARLPYDTRRVLSSPDDPVRQKLLGEIAESEAQYFLYHAYQKFHGKTQDEIVRQLLGRKADKVRSLAALFYAWNPAGTPDALTSWLGHYAGKNTIADVPAMVKAYGNPRLNISDYGYLLGVHPLDLWCAGELAGDPSRAWSALWDRSATARKIASSWLFKTRNRSAQDLRLRIRFEQDAFQRMTSFWQRLGFPFERLVPSYATAIGSSGDRPAALARLMGILLNDGVRCPTVWMTSLRFARGTPYETALESHRQAGETVLPAVVARTILPVLSGVVEKGTARRVAGVFRLPDGKPWPTGGKTGSGDNRYEAIGHHGEILSAEPVNRTATFVFYIGDRFFGVLTAYVPGEVAGHYTFTSALPVSLLKLLAPAIESRMAAARPGETPANHGFSAATSWP